MKNIASRYLLPFALAALISSCGDELELQPYQSISEDVALTTDANVKNVLVGAYDQLSDGDLMGGNILRNAELLGGDGEVTWVGTFNGPREIFNKAMIASNEDVQAFWLDAFRTINTANNVLSALEVVDEDDRAAVEGEALFIRALLYFELARFYGKPYLSGQTNSQPAVPLVLEPTRGIDDKAFVSRATVEEVYAQVIADLTRAESLLPEENDWRAGQYAAAALLARVYLQMGRCAEARDAANRVIASGNFGLMNNYADVFGRDENSREDIFAIQVTTQDGINNMNTFFSVPEFGGRDGDIEVTPAHLALYPAGDERAELFFERGGATFTGKFNNQFGNLTIIRLAEMHLIRAEANLCAGTSIGATPLEDYNAIRTRAGLAAATSVTAADITQERRRELAFEGFKVHDLRRLRQQVGTLAFDADKLVFPVPIREINANPNLTQNPGY